MQTTRKPLDGAGESALSTRDLTRDFGVRPVLRGVNWDVPRGAAVGLLGRNGGGKTTLLHVAVGLIPPTSGRCATLGQDATRLDDDRLARIGFVDQRSELLEWLSVEQHVDYAALMQPWFDRGLAERLLRELELDVGARTRVGSLSEGLRQRLAVVLAVSHRPELLVLDEPVSAQDPIARRQILEQVLERVVDDGTTVVISSHVLRDVESVVDRVAMLDGGRIVCDEELDDLKERYGASDSGALDLEGLFPRVLADAREAGGVLR
ncbi:MAG: ABC transporter ATP-binding protein [Planctomycetota bacterium]